MSMAKQYIAMFVFVGIAFTHHAFAQGTGGEPTTYNCGEIYSTAASKSYQLDPAMIEYCVQRGWDPPGANRPAKFNWQPAGGKPVRTGTAGSSEFGGRQPPSNPPGSSSTGNNSTSADTASHNIGLPNLGGSRCINIAGQSTCPSCSVSGNQSSCNVQLIDPQTGQTQTIPAGTAAASVPTIPNPVGGDLTGRLGEITRLTGGQTQLPCGGSVTISGAEVATVPNATHLVITEEDSRRLRVYRRSGNQFAYLREVVLDKDLCGADGRTRPVRQFVFFNTAQPYVVLRALQPLEEAQEQEDPAPLYNTGSDEKYVLVAPGSLINGGDRPSCERFERYPTSVQDFRIIPSSAPEDDTEQLPLNAPGCENNTLHLDLSSPALVVQPNAVVQAFNIAGHNEVAVSTTETNILFVQPESFMRLGTAGASFVLTGNAILDLQNLQALHMYSPTTITGGAAGRILLEGGGHIEDNDGNVIQRIAPNTVFNPPGVTPPYYIVSDQRIYIPAGLTLLSTPAGIIREPVAPPQGP